MITVFIGGSRQLGRVSSEVAQRLDNIVRGGLRVVIGDANGFDRAVQAYLAGRGYGDVLVYCTAGECRNNVGKWPVVAIEYSGDDRGRRFYTAKDDAMLAAADCGLFAWDHRSKGTLRNIRKMAEAGKPSAVYISSLRKLPMVRGPDDASVLTGDADGAGTVRANLFSNADDFRVEAR